MEVVAQQTTIDALGPAELARLVASFDDHFILPTGSIDLLTMSNRIQPVAFRRYIELSRALRALKPR